MALHRNLRAVCKQEVGAVAEFLDEAEYVIPTPAVQARRVIAQFVQDLVHLKRSKNRFDQNGRPNAALRYAYVVLRKDKHIIPQARFQMALHLWQVKIRAGSARQQLLRIME